MVLTWSEQGRHRMRSIPPAQLADLRKKSEEYLRFRRAPRRGGAPDLGIPAPTRLIAMRKLKPSAKHWNNDEYDGITRHNYSATNILLVV
jgi:hypothetical protein